MVTQDAATDGTTRGADPNGSDSSQCELLITRGTYRINRPAGSGKLDLPFYGNHWKVASGHQIRIDLTQVDAPTYQPSKEPSSIVFADGVTLKLPTLESGDKTLDASPSELAPILPDISKLPHKVTKWVMDAAGKIVGTINGTTGTVEDVTGKDKHSDDHRDHDQGQLPTDSGGGTDNIGDGTDTGQGGSDNGIGGSDNSTDSDPATGHGGDTESKLPAGRGR